MCVCVCMLVCVCLHACMCLCMYVCLASGKRLNRKQCKRNMDRGGQIGGVWTMCLIAIQHIHIHGATTIAMTLSNIQCRLHKHVKRNIGDNANWSGRRHKNIDRGGRVGVYALCDPIAHTKTYTSTHAAPVAMSLSTFTHNALP